MFDFRSNNEKGELPPRKPKVGLGAVLGILGLIISWVGFMFFPFTLIIDVPLFVYACRTSRPAGIACLALSSYSVLLLTGVLGPLFGYWDGGATFVGLELCPPVIFGDYNSTYGARREPLMGDIDWPIQRLHDIPNNLVLLGLCKLFGPVHGNYHGPLPTAQQAFNLAQASGVALDPARLQPPRLTVGGQTVKIDAAAVAQCLNWTEYFIPGGQQQEYKSDPAQPLALAVYQGQCLVVWTSTLNGGLLLSLVDPATGRFIAREAFAPDTWPTQYQPLVRPAVSNTPSP